MDKNTGDIRYIPNGQRLRPNEIPVNLPRKNCKKCYGRGWNGYFSDGTVMPCSCIKRII